MPLRMLLLVLIIACGNVCVYGSLKADNLRTEYKSAPLGIDVVIPRFSWEIVSNERNVVQSAYEVKAAKSETDLKEDKNLLWDSKKIVSGQSIQVEYAGEVLQSGERVYWQVRVYDNHNNTSNWSVITFFEMGLLKSSDWRGTWIEPKAKESSKLSSPCPMLRKEFNLGKKIKQARLYASSHGLYWAEMNGKKISEQLFTPGWTSFNKRLQYQTYDVTSQLQEGLNTIGVILGDGWYRGFLTWDKKRNAYGKTLALLLQLEVTYDDGSKEVISSDGTWKSSTGPILKSDIYDGELYDARLEKANWSSNGYNDAGWKNVIPKNYSKEILIASYGPPVKKIQEIKPIHISKSPDGATLVDMGQNMVGQVRLQVSGKAGTKIKLRYAEVLDKQGNIYTENLRKALQTDEFILKGDGQEIFEPHFTFHGFRYIAVTGFPGELTADNLSGLVIHSDMKPSGSFTCSDSLINQLQHNIVWGLKGNFLDVPTDCPQRDERLGWTGDAQVFCPTACFNMDAASFYTKWLGDLQADQMKNGAIPHVIPDILHQSAAAGWADAGVVIPYTVYLKYGDTRILKEHYESMKAWVNYMKNVAGDSCLWKKGAQFADWLSVSSTDKSLIATAYYAYSTSILQKTSAILGKKEDAAEYEKQFNKIKQAFQKEYISTGNHMMLTTQTADVMALAFNLVQDSLRKHIAENLDQDVKKSGHITTGFLGTPLISQVLTQNGYTDEAFLLLMNKKYPSWLYPVTMGATTIWERWDGIRPDGTFQDKGMNSFNHYAYGAIGNWLYSAVAGIELNPEEPGYKKFTINPHIGGNLTSAKASYQSVYGRIESGWQISNNEMTLTITVPPNTTAQVYLPSENKNDITESGKPLGSGSDLKLVEERGGQSVVEVGSGEYVFRVKMAGK